MAAGRKGARTKTVPPSLGRTATSKEGDNGWYECPICEEVIRDESKMHAGEDAIFCEGSCRTWLHRKCAGLSKSAFERLQGSEDPFRCPHCYVAKMQQELADTKRQIVLLREEIAQAHEDLKQFSGKSQGKSPQRSAKAISRKEETDTCPVKNSKADPGKKTGEDQSWRVESQDRVLRRNNVIVFGLKREEGKNVQEDVANLLKERLQVQVDANEIVEAMEIGKKSSTTPRPILIKAATRECKVRILRQKRLLKGSNIWINDDYTKMQRNHLLQLKERAKEAREDGCENVYISNGLLWVDGLRLGSVDSGLFPTDE